jgi:hypothetical protein
MAKKTHKIIFTSRGKPSCENLQTGKLLVLDFLASPVEADL